MQHPDVANLGLRILMLVRAKTAAAILLGLTVITAWSWRGVVPHPGGSPPTDEILATENASPNTLIVDFRDDITAEELAARGLLEEPVSRFSATDRMYRVHFRTPQDAEDAARRLRTDPWSSRSTTTPR